MHVALGGLGGDAVQQLHFTHGSQGADGHDLGLAAGEHGGTVGTGQHAGLAPDGAHFGELSGVGTDAFVDYAAAHDFLLDGVQRVAHFGHALSVLLGEVLVHFGLDLLFPRLALGTVEGLEHPFHFVVGVLAHIGFNVVTGQLQGELLLGLADLAYDVLLELDDALDLLVGEEDGLEHDFLAHFVGARLDHQHGFLGAGHGQIQSADFALLLGGIDNELVVHKADVDRAYGAGEGDLADAQGGGSADHGGSLGRAVKIDAHHGGGDRHVVPHSLGEEGTQGTVDQAAGQYGLFAGTAFAPVPGTGDVAYGIQLFLIVHAQREEVDAGTDGLAYGGVDQHGGVAVAHEGAAGGLFGVFAELQSERASAQLHRIALEHGFPPNTV